MDMPDLRFDEMRSNVIPAATSSRDASSNKNLMHLRQSVVQAK